MGRLDSKSQTIGGTLNEYKYDLMVLNQDIGKVVTSRSRRRILKSKSRKTFFQEKIEKIKERRGSGRGPEAAGRTGDGDSKKFVDEKGGVRIWGASSNEKETQS